EPDQPLRPRDVQICHLAAGAGVVVADGAESNPNNESPMTKEISKSSEPGFFAFHWAFGFWHCFDIRHSGFVILKCSRPDRKKSADEIACGTEILFSGLPLVSVVADGFDRAAFLGFLALGFFLRRT